MASSKYTLIRQAWRGGIARWLLIPAELVGLVPILVLFGIAQPDLFRTKLWRVGFVNHFNSNPDAYLYALANHRAPPPIPFVWSLLLTNFNVAISITSLFVLLIKSILLIMRVWHPVIGLFFSLALTTLYTISTAGQAGPDYTDPRYPSRSPWYLSKSCDYAEPYGLVKSCQLAKGTFAVTVYMLFIYILNVTLAIWSMWPTKQQPTNDGESDDGSTNKPKLQDKEWEMQPPAIPATYYSPFTPRTQAFHTLDGQLAYQTTGAP